MSDNNPIHKEITDYFRLNIYEAMSAYSAWKMISHSKWIGVVTEEMAERYAEIQRYHPNFFISAERAFLVDFVMMSLHSFDKRDDSYSLYKVDREATEKFEQNNINVIKPLRDARHKIFAHRDIYTSIQEYKIPSVIDLDNFFKNLIEFYNKLTSIVDDSSTRFSNAEEIKHDIELLFMNLYRGESMRKKEIDIKWKWAEDIKKASDIL